MFWQISSLTMMRKIYIDEGGEVGEKSSLEALGMRIVTNPTSFKRASRWRLLEWLVPECVFRVFLEQDLLFRASELIKVSYKYFFFFFLNCCQVSTLQAEPF